ncbi:MAG: high-potential iron-sulfur protein [Pseudomonadota bacterium]|nr:high-potential iron-sulfur protein [Pseudomonadota bacterium]
MSDKPMNKSRRDAVKMMLGGMAAVPLMNLVGMAAAQAEDLPHVDEATDPTAIALKYKHDATQADRAAAARPGKPPEEQDCTNCQFIQADSGEWRPCQLFPGKAVNEKGWCASWTLKAAA